MINQDEKEINIFKLSYMSQIPINQDETNTLTRRERSFESTATLLKKTMAPRNPQNTKHIVTKNNPSNSVLYDSRIFDL